MQCGFNHRFHPSVIKAKKLITKNFIGKIINIRATYGVGEMDMRMSGDQKKSTQSVAILGNKEFTLLI